MLDINQIQNVHVELSSLCNASCPWCMRTFWGYPYNSGYPEVNLSIDSAKKIFSRNFLKQLKSINIEGNLGDLVMNPDTPLIVEYFYECNSQLQITGTTNGSARDSAFWSKLGNTSIKIEFCLDGLEDTHHLYRQNTSWKTIIKNAQAFVDAGGYAIWKFIKFDHNKHQIEECKQLSKNLGFAEFVVAGDGRNTAPVFNKKGELTHTLGNYQGENNFKILFHKKKTDTILVDDVVGEQSPKQTVTCFSKSYKSIYIAATGDVFPCCWTGFYPNTFGHGQYYQAINSQLKPLISNNNAITYELEECIQWFNKIESSWKIDNYNKGRLVICDHKCGR